MRTRHPRVAPLSDAEMSPAQNEATASIRERIGKVPNIARTLVRAPRAFAAISAMGAYLSSEDCALGARERELVILRVAYRCRSGYEWTAHAGLGRTCGLTDEEIDLLKRDAVEGLAESDAALVRAVDEIQAAQFVSDAAWRELGRHFADEQRMDAIFTAAQYTQLAILLNTFGVQMDENHTLDPDFAPDA